MEFDEIVTYKITPALITITLKTFSNTNPISKVYDGTNNLASSVIVNDMKLEGIFARDENQVFVVVYKHLHSFYIRLLKGRSHYSHLYKY